MRMLITGGAGFIGFHLTKRLLAEAHEVVILDDLSTGTLKNVELLKETGDPRGTLRFLEADVREPVQLRRFDRIFHLACPASPRHYQDDPIHTIETAVIGTRNVLEAAARWRARVVIASTSEVYGDPEVHPQPEDYHGNVNPFGPRAMYDEGKRAAEALAWSYRHMAGADVRVARIFNTYGPRMRFDDGRVVSNFILQALRGEPLTIYGDGTQTRSFCYVDDLVDGLVRLMDNPCDLEGGGPPVNLGNPVEFSMLALAHVVLEAVHGQGDADWGGHLRFEPLPPDDPTRRQPDITRARSLLGWEPTTRLADGIARTVADFRVRLAQPASSRIEGGLRRTGLSMPDGE